MLGQRREPDQIREQHRHQTTLGVERRTGWRGAVAKCRSAFSTEARAGHKRLRHRRHGAYTGVRQWMQNYCRMESRCRRRDRPRSPDRSRRIHPRGSAGGCSAGQAASRIRSRPHVQGGFPYRAPGSSSSLDPTLAGRAGVQGQPPDDCSGRRRLPAENPRRRRRQACARNRPARCRRTRPDTRALQSLIVRCAARGCALCRRCARAP